jgi:hypothetical protein
MSTVFHPQTDGRSEKTNKTTVQVLRNLIARSQKHWVRHLPQTEFAINAAVNEATGVAPFKMVLGFVPLVEDMLVERQAGITAARDELAASKIREAEQVNRHRQEEPIWTVGDLVMNDSKDRRARYKTGVSQNGKKEMCSAKLFPRWDRPYPITEAFPEQSQYRLDLGPEDKLHNMFNVDKLKLYVANDVEKFPNREPACPEPVIVGGGEEYFIKAIMDEKRERGKRLLYMHWASWPTDAKTWEVLENVEETEAFDVWEKSREAGGRSIFLEGEGARTVPFACGDGGWGDG